MKRFALCLLLLFSIHQTASAQKAVEHTGSLSAEIKIDTGMGGLRYKLASAEEKAKLPEPPGEGDQVYAGKIDWQRKRDAGSLSLLVEPVKGEPFIYVDINQDGTFTSAERFYFSPLADKPGVIGEVSLKFPMKNSAFKHYPMKLQLPKPTEETQKSDAQKKDTKIVSMSFDAYAEGTVDINGRKTLVRYNVNPQTGVIDPTQGYLGIDGNGDGKVDMSFVSPEAAFAKKETVVFRVGDRYVSTKSVDLASLKVTLKEHPASEYQRIELSMGGEIPDFAFTDFDGKARKLSEFRGKYLLLDFWGTWCGPCVADIPHLKEAYAKYKSRGFEILGMDEDKSLDEVKAFIAQKEMTWPQAATPSIEELLEKRFRITAFPTLVLLDPQGKIVSLGRKGQMPLRGKELLDTLEKLLPSPK